MKSVYLILLLSNLCSFSLKAQSKDPICEPRLLETRIIKTMLASDLTKHKLVLLYENNGLVIKAKYSTLIRNTIISNQALDSILNLRKSQKNDTIGNAYFLNPKYGAWLTR